MERVMGIEPTLSAWKAEVLPLNYTRLAYFQAICSRKRLRIMPANSTLASYEGTLCLRNYGGGGRIRTFEGIRRQIYSLIPLASSGTPPHWGMYCETKKSHCQTQLTTDFTNKKCVIIEQKNDYLCAIYGLATESHAKTGVSLDMSMNSLICNCFSKNISNYNNFSCFVTVFPGIC